METVDLIKMVYGFDRFDLILYDTKTKEIITAQLGFINCESGIDAAIDIIHRMNRRRKENELIFVAKTTNPFNPDKKKWKQLI